MRFNEVHNTLDRFSSHSDRHFFFFPEHQAARIFVDKFLNHSSLMDHNTDVIVRSEISIDLYSVISVRGDDNGRHFWENIWKIYTKKRKNFLVSV